MAKLKYDRVINVEIGSNKNVEIPNDEVWRVTTKSNVGGTNPSTKLYGGGYTFDSRYLGAPISGIAFKHVEE